MRCKECGHSRDKNEGAECMGCGEWICQYCNSFFDRHIDRCEKEYEKGLKAWKAEQEEFDAREEEEEANQMDEGPGVPRH